MFKLKKVSTKVTIIMVALLIVVSAFSVGALTSEKMDISAEWDGEAVNGTVAVDAAIAELADKQVSVMAFAPDFTGAPNPLQAVYLDQYAVAADGKLVFSFPIKNPVANKDYSLYINGQDVGSFKFVIEEPTTTEAPTTTEEPTTTEPGGDKYLLGDANLDGSVKIDDALLVQKYVAKLVKFDIDAEIQPKTANAYNTDTVINLKDVLEIQKFVAGKLPADTAVGKPIS